MTEDEVVREIQKRCWRLGVSVLFSPKKTVVADGCHCAGYFDGESDTPVLAVAWGMPKEHRLGVLLHEYCHATQHYEKTPVYTSASMDFTTWFAGKGHKNPKKAIDSCRDMEEDCERRTIRLIAELDAPVNVEAYCQSANAYLHGHNSMFEYRSWFTKSLYELPNVLAGFNKTLDDDFSKTPYRMRKLLSQCFKK